MQRRHSSCACALFVFVLLAVPGPARAQQPTMPASPNAMQQPASPGAAQPLAKPDATQPAAEEQSSRLAEERFIEGTRLFKQWRFEEAEQRFREALAHREHPLMHVYLSRALEKQGRLVEAHEALQRGLRAGVDSLPHEEVQVAKALHRSLISRVARIDVHCDVPGAEVFLDGEPWFTTPRRARRVIAAGQHVLVARKPGYFPIAEPVSLFPGKQTRVTLRMTADVVHVERRWRSWQPWTVAGAGLATFLAGGLFLWQARTDYAAIQRELDACGGGTCDLTSTRRLDRGEWKERIGTGALIVGGSAVAAGLAGVLLNQPRSRRSEPAHGLERLDIMPVFSGGSTGISARIQF